MPADAFRVKDLKLDWNAGKSFGGVVERTIWCRSEFSSSLGTYEFSPRLGMEIGVAFPADVLQADILARQQISTVQKQPKGGKSSLTRRVQLSLR